MMHGGRVRCKPAEYHHAVDRVTWRDRLRYRFDEFMGRGTIALILGLFAISVVLIVAVAAVVWLAGVARDQDLDFPTLLRYGLLRTLDPGTMGGDQGTAGFLLGMFAITLGGIFVISTLIGILTTGIEGKLAELRKGRSRVIEREHTVILGWSQQIFTIISELVAANANQRAPLDRDPGRARQGRDGGRDPRPGRVDGPDARSSAGPAARWTSTTCGSRACRPRGRSSSWPRRATTRTPTSSRRSWRSPTTRIAARSRTTSWRRSATGRTSRSPAWSAATRSSSSSSEDLIARITAQTCRQSGLSVVYAELLDFAGDEIYFDRPAGARRQDVRRDASACSPMRRSSGCVPAGGTPHLNPSSGIRDRAGDRLIVIAADDDQIHLSGGPGEAFDEAVLRDGHSADAEPERTLVLGWNRRAAAIIRELDAYVPPGSETQRGGDRRGGRRRRRPARRAPVRPAGLAPDRGSRATGRSSTGSASRRTTTSSSCATTRWIARGPTRGRSSRCFTCATSRSRLDRDFSIVSEMLDLRNRALAEVARADDFIVSDRLISLLMAQVAETKHAERGLRRPVRPGGLGDLPASRPATTSRSARRRPSPRSSRRPGAGARSRSAIASRPVRTMRPPPTASRSTRRSRPR